MANRSKGQKYKRTSNAPYCPEHQSWMSMWQRCVNNNNKSYDRYGGRGIKVCDRWRDFFKFMEDMGRRPPGTSLDRYPNNDGNYEPGNCRWATDEEQVENRRCTIWVTIGKERKPLTYWCRKYNVEREVVKHRHRRHGDWVRAIKEATRDLNAEAIIYVEIEGVRKTAREWCKEYNIRFQKAWSRVNRDGWDWIKAIITPTVPQSDRNFPWDKVTINGETKSLRQWCLALGIPGSTIWKRMKKRGMTAEQALLASKKINQYK